jgi:methylated-DNA-[protein]-cysteine S-methyltransferase
MLTLMKIESPLGELRVVATERALVGLYLPVQASIDAPAGRTPLLERAAAQLAEYFAGERRVFELPLAPTGTAFQHRVWDGLAEIPYGALRSYGELARGLGRPTASRAVGMANSKNPLSIVVPCHRVVAATGELTGYAGGMAAKAWLLDHERRHARQATEGDAAQRC